MAKLRPAVCVGSDRGFGYKEIGAMGHAAGPKFKAQMDLGTLVPYM